MLAGVGLGVIGLRLLGLVLLHFPHSSGERRKKNPPVLHDEIAARTVTLIGTFRTTRVPIGGPRDSWSSATVNRRATSHHSVKSELLSNYIGSLNIFEGLIIERKVSKIFTSPASMS